MEITYSHEKKRKLAERISKSRKRDMVEIFKIIYEDNKNITENQNGLFMLFHKLNDTTYHKIELYLKSVNKKKTIEEQNRSSENCEKKEYRPYIKDDFVEQEQLNPKLKYSNKEKNIIKRQRYDNQLNNDNINESGIVYQKFDVGILSDSETNSDKKNNSDKIIITDKKTNSDKKQNCDILKKLKII